MKPMALLSITYYVLKLFAQTAVLSFTYLLKRRRSNNAFRNQLVESGLSKAEAEKLTKVYSSSFSVRRLVTLMRSREPKPVH